MSNHILRSLIYLRSNTTISWKLALFRRVTCHNPVHPGLTNNRCLSYSVYSATSRGNGGRGPTKLICPNKTFISCGNSSKLYLRMNLD